jgi:C1A family cysteine protease
MKLCLAEGYPFVFAVRIYSTFSTAETNGGHVAMPSNNELPSAKHGGHAMLAVGYSDPHKLFIVKNSWGEGWVSILRKTNKKIEKRIKYVFHLLG